MLQKKKTHMLNGVNVDDLTALIEGVKANPAAGETKWKVASAWRGRTHNRSTVSSFHIGGTEVRRRFTIDIDEPEELGGANQFANPQEHLIAALNSCMMVGYVALCSLNGIRLESLEVEVEGDIDLRGFFGLNEDIAPGYEKLNCTVKIKGDATEAQFREIHDAVIKTSPNFYNLSKAVPVDADLLVE